MLCLTRVKNVLLFFLIGLYSVNTSNILVLEEMLCPSHHLWLKKLIISLASNGHNVTSLSADFEKDKILNVHYIHLENEYVRRDNGKDAINYFRLGDLDKGFTITEYHNYIYEVCDAAIHSQGWKRLMNYANNFTFDLVLHDFFGGICHLMFLEKFGDVPLVSVTAYNDLWHTAEFTGLILMPSISEHSFAKNFSVTFFNRIKNYIQQSIEYLHDLNVLYTRLNILLNPLGTSAENLTQIRRRLNVLTLLNYDPSLEVVQQVPYNVIGVGGLHIDAAKELPQDLQNIMEFSNKGVILFSLGTNVRSDTLGDELIIQIIEAFRSIPEYTFLWKFESKHFPVELPKNVKIRQWLPQNDILAHPKTKLFISHCGLLSTQEATWHGVPMLGIPIFADQFMNIEKSVRSGVAERLFVKDITNITLKDKILTVLNTPSYLENMKIRSKNFRDQKESPLERAVWWIEWVLRNPNATHLRSPGLHMSFIQRQSIDVISFLTVSVILVLVIMVYILKKILYILTKNMFKKLLKSKSD